MVKSLEQQLLEETRIPISTYISMRTRGKLDEYLSYMKRPPRKRTHISREWPKKISEVVEEALLQFLADHPAHEAHLPRLVVKPRGEMIDHDNPVP